MVVAAGHKRESSPFAVKREREKGEGRKEERGRGANVEPTNEGQATMAIATRISRGREGGKKE